MVHANTAYDLRQTIRNRIRPFPAQSPDKKTFTVGWTDCPQTFEQIIDTLRSRIVDDLLYFKKVAREYISELLQQGWLRLWQALTDDENFLADFNEVKASDFISNRCGSSTLQYYLKRYSSYHQFSNWSNPDSDVFEDNITDIVIGSSLKSTGRGRHALFTRKLDVYVDISRAIQQVAEWCGDNLKKLVALYYITTSVSQVDAGRIAGLKIKESKGRKPRCAALQYWTRQVLSQLQTVLESYRPIEPNQHYWRECLKSGDTEPVIQLATKYADNTMKLFALYGLTTSVSRRTLVEELGVDDCVLGYAMEQIRQELRCIYARRVRNTI